MTHLVIDVDELRPLIELVVRETVAKLGDGRLGYSEPEAAAMLGLNSHQLRDARLRGEIHAKRIGKSFRYSRNSLERLLEE